MKNGLFYNKKKTIANKRQSRENNIPVRKNKHHIAKGTHINQVVLHLLQQTLDSRVDSAQGAVVHLNFQLRDTQERTVTLEHVPRKVIDRKSTRLNSSH